MSFRQCMVGKVQTGQADAQEANAAADLFEGLEADARETMSDFDARRLAAEETRKIIDHEVRERKRRELLSALRHASIDQEIKIYRNGAGHADQKAAIFAYFDRTEINRGISSIVARKDQIRGQAHAQMEEAIDAFRRDWAGRARNKATQRDMVREAFGQDSGNPAAKALARAWAETAENLRMRFNQAGGDIPKLEDWGLPQVHDVMRLQRVNKDAWIDAVLPRLDLAKMSDQTGQAFTPKSIRIVLGDVYDTITTGGWAGRTPSPAIMVKSLARRRADHRFLVFKSADDWLAYQNEFGNPLPFETMMAHIDAMARDIAQLEILGPNPSGTVHMLQQRLTKMEKLKTVKGTGAADRLGWLHEDFTGASNIPSNIFWANTMGAVRNVLTSAFLGSAAISALGDAGFSRVAANFAGLDANRVWARHVRLLRPGNAADRRMAVRMGLVADHASQKALSHARFVGEMTGPKWSEMLADRVLTWSGLNVWTQAGRWAFGMEFMGTLADYHSKSFARLNPALRRTLKRHGFDAGDWDAIRKTALFEPERDARFLRPDDIAKREDLPSADAQHLATRVMEMIHAETEYAVPSGSARGRTFTRVGTRPGTFGGEFLRSATLFKGFAVTIMFTQAQRIMGLPTVRSRLAYAGHMGAMMMLFGALSLQLKDISKGQDPRPMDTGKFWVAALAQGGALGILGDFLFADHNRFGQGFVTTLAGPVAGALDDLTRLTYGNVQAAMDERPDNVDLGPDLIRFAGRYTPGNSLWYARLILDRAILDQVQTAIDPEHRHRFRRVQDRVRQDLDSGFWWAPGQASPDRVPNVGNVLGEINDDR